jgi:uncharacterized delta-60 repeat protein
VISNTKQQNPAIPQKGSFLHPVRWRFPVGTRKYQFPLRLAIIVLLFVFILLLNIPFSGGAAHPFEWTFPSFDQQNQSDIYLPLVAKNTSFSLMAPVLNPISNDDSDGNYTVTWTAAEGAESYLLQEDDNSAFSSPTTAYEGSSTTKAISGREVGSYYYRVMASNAYASSEWSNIESVVVSVPAPDCPQTGSWRGTTSQNESIEFIVEDSPTCQIAAGSLSISYDTYPCGSATTYFLSAFPITDDQFSVFSPEVDATGEFTAADLATGTLLVDYYSVNGRCYYSGSWEAYPVVGANGPVFDLLVQPDDMIVLGGQFSEVGQQPHENLARLIPDGSLDSAFTPDFNNSVLAVAIQTDDKILAGGAFSQVDGQPHASIARLNPDGSLDTGFNAQIEGDLTELALQSDGKILVGGWFSAVNGQPRSSLARLNADGTLDEAFIVNSAYMDVYALAVQPDDKILVGGYIQDVSGETWADYFVRLNADGTLDTTFQPDTGGWWVYGLVVLPDGKIMAAIQGDLARFDADGNRDTSFDSPETDNQSIRTVALQSDGALVVGGDFHYLDENPIEYLARLDASGALNLAFNPSPNDEVYTLVVQDDNKILVGGAFTQINGQVRHSIARLNPDGSLDESFSIGP